MEHVRIIGCGKAAGEQKITNKDLENIVETSDEWITTRTGIRSRYISSSRNTSDLAIEAAANAIQSAGINPHDIRLIIVATLTPDCVTPSVACMVQAALGLNEDSIMAFDLNAACSGFLFALQTASSLLQEGYGLVIGAETLSKILNWEDRSTCVLFGDGAGACVIERDENASMTFYARSSGDTAHALYCGSRSLQKDMHNVKEDKQYLEMNGREVFRFATRAMPDAIHAVMQDDDIDTIDLIIPHQANQRILDYVSKKMKIPMEKMVINLDEFGNTSSASVPIALAAAWEEGRIHYNMTIVLVGFGAGFTWGACRIETGGKQNDDQ